VRRAWLRLLVGPVMVLAVAVIAANLVVFAAWTGPRWRTRLGVLGASGGGASARQRVEPAMQRMRDSYGRLTSAEERVSTFREELITTLGGSDLLGMLGAAGEVVGIDIDDADFQFVPIPELGIVRLVVTVPVAGTYEAVRALLDELLDLPVFLVVDAIALQATGEDSSLRPATPADDSIRVDLTLSVFLDDDGLAGGARGPAAPVIPVSAAGVRAAETLRQAARSEDPEAIADAILAQLQALPALPVDPASLRIELPPLDAPPEIIAPSRNLFSVVRPAAPTPTVLEEPVEVAPRQPVMPVRLLGIVLIEGRWHASLTDDVALFVAEAGDRLPNGVQVVEVGADYVELELGDLRARLTLEGSR